MNGDYRNAQSQTPLVQNARRAALSIAHCEAMIGMTGVAASKIEKHFVPCIFPDVRSAICTLFSSANT